MGVDVTQGFPEILRGAKAIGKAIGLDKRQANRQLKTGQLKGARKVGGRWCIIRRSLMENFEPGHGSTNQLSLEELSPRSEDA